MALSTTTNTEWSKIGIWGTLITTSITAQKIFPLTVYHLSSDPKWVLSPWALLLAHFPLFLLSRFTSTTTTKRPFPINNKTLLNFISVGSGIIPYYALTYRSAGTDLASVDWSLVFLGLMSVYLFCVLSVLFPGGNVRLPLVPLTVSGGRVAKSVLILPTWVVVMIFVLAAWYLLDGVGRKSAEEEDRARYGDEKVATRTITKLSVG